MSRLRWNPPPLFISLSLPVFKLMLQYSHHLSRIYFKIVTVMSPLYPPPVFQAVYPSFLRVVGPDADFARSLGALFERHRWAGASFIFAGGRSRGLAFNSLALEVPVAGLG